MTQTHESWPHRWIVIALGVVAVGIFSTNPEHSFMVQLVGVLAYAAFTFLCALAIFGALKLTVGIRVSEEEELEGLDLAEHGSHAYDLGAGPGFLETPVAAQASQTVAPARQLVTSENG